jgi:hypothetical protein
LLLLSQWSTIFTDQILLNEKKSLVNVDMRAAALSSIVYYVISCWVSYSQLEVQLIPGLVVLFSSGFAGIQVSAELLLSSSRDGKGNLEFLLGFNGALSAFGWILIGAVQGIILLPFSIGMILFFYFSCYLMGPELKPTDEKMT